MVTNDHIHFPRCKSTQVTANKKGFSSSKAAAGVLLTGGVGLLAGTISNKEIVITCLNCGKEFKPGEGAKSGDQQPKLIWDESIKQHVVNPNYIGSVHTASLKSVLAALALIVIIIIAVFILIK